jgi:hypothetical protein
LNFKAHNERDCRNNAAVKKNLDGVTSNEAIIKQFDNIATNKPQVPALPNHIQDLSDRKLKRELRQPEMPPRKMRLKSEEMVVNNDGSSRAFGDNEEYGTRLSIINRLARPVDPSEGAGPPPDGGHQQLSAVKADGTVVARQSLSNTVRNEHHVALTVYNGWRPKLKIS